MNLAALDIAIRARLLGDTAPTVGLFALVQGVATVRAPSGGMWTLGRGERPYVVIKGGGVQNDAYEEDGIDVEYEVSVFDHTDNNLEPIAAVLDRIYGDAMAQSDRVPTFGLHRHQLTLSTDDEPSVLIRTQTESDTLPENDNVYRYTEYYRVFSTRALAEE